jgi:hypothetical protein
MSNKFYYFEEKDLVDILDKVYEEGWTGSLELKESFISDILKEHCKESEDSIKSRNIEGATRIYETTSITTKDFENPQMLLNFEHEENFKNSDVTLSRPIISDAKDINQFTVTNHWPDTNTFLWTETSSEVSAECLTLSEFHSEGINNLNNKWRIK